MNTLTLKVPEGIKEKLDTYSKKKGVSRSEIVRNALLDYFDKDELGREGSFFDLAKDLAGSINDKHDLSSNKKYLSGYGK